jgi:hypothetical protein
LVEQRVLNPYVAGSIPAFRITDLENMKKKPNKKVLQRLFQRMYEFPKTEDMGLHLIGVHTAGVDFQTFNASVATLRPFRKNGRVLAYLWPHEVDLSEDLKMGLLRGYTFDEDTISFREQMNAHSFQRSGVLLNIAEGHWGSIGWCVAAHEKEVIRALYIMDQRPTSREMIPEPIITTREVKEVPY